jgi:hypothetical protein
MRVTQAAKNRIVDERVAMRFDGFKGCKTRCCGRTSVEEEFDQSFDRDHLTIHANRCSSCWRKVGLAQGICHGQRMIVGDATIALCGLIRAARLIRIS